MSARDKSDLDAIAMLKADHRKAEDLFRKFKSAKESSKKQALAEQICLELTVHATIEEEIFYPACKSAVEDDLLNEAYVEHDGAKVLIAEILSSSPDEEFYQAKVKVFSEQIEHHVEEEEKRSEGVFAQARAAGLDMNKLADRMKACKQQLMKEFKASGIPAPETRTFTGHELEQGSPIEDAAA